MAHAFTIINSSDETVVYTDYDAIDLTTLKHVIGFIPDIGTLVESNEILLESGVFSDEQNFITEGSLSTIEVELETGTGSGGLLVETGDDVRLEDITFAGERTLVAGDNLVLDGTDSSSTNAGDNLMMNTPDGKHKLVPEDFQDGEENHLVLETASDTNIPNHYHEPVSDPHSETETETGHTDEEHRELALWAHKLDLLMARERLNAIS
jgi:hypothetical protein